VVSSTFSLSNVETIFGYQSLNAASCSLSSLALKALKAIRAAIITRVVTAVFDRRNRTIFIAGRIVWGGGEVK
jgi:hypothetical protein